MQSAPWCLAFLSSAMQLPASKQLDTPSTSHLLPAHEAPIKFGERLRNVQKQLHRVQRRAGDPGCRQNIADQLLQLASDAIVLRNAMVPAWHAAMVGTSDAAVNTCLAR